MSITYLSFFFLSIFRRINHQSSVTGTVGCVTDDADDDVDENDVDVDSFRVGSVL